MVIIYSESVDKLLLYFYASGNVLDFICVWETLVRLLNEEPQAKGASFSLEVHQGEENVHVPLPAYGKAMITVSLEQ